MRAFSQIAVHLWRRKDISACRAESFLCPVQGADVEGDSAMWGAISEELTHQVPCWLPIAVLVRVALIGEQANLLHHAPGNQSTHGVGNDDHLVRVVSLAQHQLYQVIQPGGGRLDVESVG